MNNPIAFSKTIQEALTRRVKAQGNRVAFRYKTKGEWKEVTFKNHFETIRRLSCGLLDLGIKKGDKVNILGQTSLAWSQFDMAALCAGGITVPIYPTNTPEDTTYIINHCEAKVLFVDDFNNLKKIAAISKDCPNLKKVIVNFDLKSESIQAKFEILHWNTLYDRGLSQEMILGPKVDDLIQSASLSDIFTICYTSGTTGVPKGVVLTHEAIHSVMTDVEHVMGKFLEESDSLLSFLPMSHIFGKWESMTPYFMGWTISFAESIDTLVVNLGEAKPTLWVAVPRVFEKIYSKIMTQIEGGSAAKRTLFYWALDTGKAVVKLRSEGNSVPFTLQAQYTLADKLVFSKIKAKFGGRLKFCVSGSAPLAGEIQSFMFAIGIPVYEGYGLTETCAPICVNMPDSFKIGTVGKIFPEVLVKIAEDGEILIKSKKNFTQYYKDPAATADAIKDGWFYTGDIGNIDEDGYLKITDRKKDLIKTAGGKYIAPQKIEGLAKSEKILSQVVVYGDQRPFASALLTLNQEYVIQMAQSKKILFGEYADLLKKEEIKAAVQDAIDNLNKKLARYETVKKFIVLPTEFTVESGELTPSMKIKRKLLCQKYSADLDRLYEGESSE